MSEPTSNSIARQRTSVPVPLDEEQGLPSTQENSQDYLNEKPTFRHRMRNGRTRFKHRFLRKGRRQIGVVESLKTLAFSSWLLVFIVFIPLAWVAHFSNASHHEDSVFPYALTFALCFLAIIPLEHLFDYGGEQMAFYCGTDLGELIIITLNNAVEATLAIILLTKCELRLLQSTIVGVILLHLLLIPGTTWIVGGARISEQDLHPHLTQLNHTLLTIGVMTLLLPVAFFAGGDQDLTISSPESVVNEPVRNTFLQMSRGLAIILLLVYGCSRVFLYNPPGNDNAFRVHPNAPKELVQQEEELEAGEPEISQWVCIVMLVITIGLMAATAEWLVDSIEFVREAGGIGEEWFGLILLPIISFSADGALAIGYFARTALRTLFNTAEPEPPSTLAKSRAIDLSIQFALFWMPFIVLLGWWTNKPMTLLFDLFEVAMLIGSVFVVNYVTADSKTNWLEGWSMISFYIMIALCAWFYEVQPGLQTFSECVAPPSGETNATEAVSEFLARI